MCCQICQMNTKKKDAASECASQNCVYIPHIHSLTSKEWCRKENRLGLLLLFDHNVILSIAKPRDQNYEGSSYLSKQNHM